MRKNGILGTSPIGLKSLFKIRSPTSTHRGQLQYNRANVHKQSSITLFQLEKELSKFQVVNYDGNLYFEGGVFGVERQQLDLMP